MTTQACPAQGLACPIPLDFPWLPVSVATRTDYPPRPSACPAHPRPTLTCSTSLPLPAPTLAPAHPTSQPASARPASPHSRPWLSDCPRLHFSRPHSPDFPISPPARPSPFRHSCSPLPAPIQSCTTPCACPAQLTPASSPTYPLRLLSPAPHSAPLACPTSPNVPPHPGTLADSPSRPAPARHSAAPSRLPGPTSALALSAQPDPPGRVFPLPRLSLRLPPDYPAPLLLHPPQLVPARLPNPHAARSRPFRLPSPSRVGPEPSSPLRLPCALLFAPAPQRHPRPTPLRPAPTPPLPAPTSQPRSCPPTLATARAFPTHPCSHRLPRPRRLHPAQSTPTPKS